MSLLFLLSQFELDGISIMGVFKLLQRLSHYDKRRTLKIRSQIAIDTWTLCISHYVKKSLFCAWSYLIHLLFVLATCAINNLLYSACFGGTNKVLDQCIDSCTHCILGSIGGISDTGISIGLALVVSQPGGCLSVFFPSLMSCVYCLIFCIHACACSPPNSSLSHQIL